MRPVRERSHIHGANLKEKHMPSGLDALGPRKPFQDKSGTRITPLIDAGLLSAVGGGSQLHELSITRFFDAPRERVFEAFTNPNHARHWMGPRGFKATQYEQDARPGGKWRTTLHQTESWRHGRVIPDLGLGGEFKEVVPPERLVYTFAWEGQGGQPTRETV